MKKMKNDTKSFLHQGDVFVLPLDRVPDLTGFIEQPNTILAYGEATGHHHKVVGGDKVRFFRNDRTAYLLVEGDGAQLVHEEHRAHGLLPGAYEIRIQKERSLEDVGWRRVVD